jgi:hypothetical protein
LTARVSRAAMRGACVLIQPMSVPRVLPRAHPGLGLRQQDPLRLDLLLGTRDSGLHGHDLAGQAHHIAVAVTQHPHGLGTRHGGA